MNLRRTTTTRRALAAATIAAGLVLSMAGCGGDGDKNEGDAAKSSAPAQQGSDSKSKPSAPATDKTLAEVKSNGITLAVTSATRDQGGFLNITGTVTNGTSALWLGTTWKSDETELRGNGGSVAGASLVDQEGKKKYLVLRDTQGRCLCTKFEGGIDQGKSADWFAQFPAPPEGTKSVQLQVPTMPPAQLNLTEGE
ncbi:hypothetical protein [Streptomyces endophyticus]|uniref:Lipoprotein n=1 Tax=Streptomyces endophyticus TaxID=714166 RepID=A0ABU6F7T8_9ACTN|nr:hypothetical protein [Streptomyces endophyticus]MEB8340049.1 hypothetical protein [Streptomyces endophyticus]